MKFLFTSKPTLIVSAAILMSTASLLSAQVMGPPYRINCGGQAFTDSQGNAWEGDGHYTGGDVYGTSDSISGTSDDVLYQSERWFDPAQPALKYDFDVPNGSYTVRLHMAEIYRPWFAVGGRVFNISINEVKVAENYDIFAEVGGNVATIKNYPVTVSNGTVSITFANVTQHAKVCGIEVLDAATVNAHLKANKGGVISLKTSGSSITFSARFPSAYSVILRDIRGGKLAQKSGMGAADLRFNNLLPGVYFVESKFGNSVNINKVCILR